MVGRTLPVVVHEGAVGCRRSVHGLMAHADWNHTHADWRHAHAGGRHAHARGRHARWWHGRTGRYAWSGRRTCRTRAGRTHGTTVGRVAVGGHRMACHSGGSGLTSVLAIRRQVILICRQGHRWTWRTRTVRLGVLVSWGHETWRRAAVEHWVGTLATHGRGGVPVGIGLMSCWSKVTVDDLPIALRSSASIGVHSLPWPMSTWRRGCRIAIGGHVGMGRLAAITAHGLVGMHVAIRTHGLLRRLCRLRCRSMLRRCRAGMGGGSRPSECWSTVWHILSGRAAVCSMVRNLGDC